MPISFPTSPTLNQEYSYGNKTWTWNGTQWNLTINFEKSLQGLSGIQGIKGKLFNFITSAFNANSSITYTTNIPAGNYLIQSSRDDSITTIGSSSITGTGTINLISSQSSVTVTPTKYYNKIKPPLFSWYNYPNCAAAYGNGTWIVPDSYQIYKFTDNTFSSWYYVTLPNAPFPNKLLFINGFFIYGAESGKMAVSTDGSSWTSRTNGFGTNSIYGITYGNGLYVAGGGGGALQTSTDTITWTTQTSGFGTNYIYGLAYGNGVYVAVGASGTITTSTDGVTWNTQTSNFGSNTIYDVIFDNTKFIAGASNGQINTSTDGITWTTRKTGGSGIRTLAYNGTNSYLYTAYSGGMGSSTDGITWTTQKLVHPTVATSGTVYGGYGNGIFVILDSVTGYIYSSTYNDAQGSNPFNIITTLTPASSLTTLT